MEKYAKLLQQMKASPKTVRFAELSNLCCEYFGKPRNKGSSHFIYKTPWPDNPRVNIQKGKNGMAKAYQVRQVLAAVNKYEVLKND